MIEIEDIIARLKYLRDKYDVSQKEFGDMIGFSQGNVGDWERGRSLPSTTALIAIVNKFNVTSDWLLFGNDNTSNDSYPLLRDLNPSEMEMLDTFVRFLRFNREEEKKKTAQQELSMVKETIYEYLPLIGRAAAGKPILIDEMVQGYIPVEAKNHQYTNCYLIEANGDSMIGKGIESGDLVIVRPQPAVDNGDVSLVRIEDEATIKCFYKEHDVIYLKSANEKYAPMKFTINDNIAIIGKVIDTLKKDAQKKMIIPETEERLKEYKNGLRITVKNNKPKAV